MRKRRRRERERKRRVRGEETWTPTDSQLSLRVTQIWILPGRKVYTSCVFVDPMCLSAIPTVYYNIVTKVVVFFRQVAGHGMSVHE